MGDRDLVLREALALYGTRSRDLCMAMIVHGHDCIDAIYAGRKRSGTTSTSRPPPTERICADRCHRLRG